MSHQYGASKRSRSGGFEDLSEIEVRPSVPHNPQISEIQNLERELQTLRREKAHRAQEESQEIRRLQDENASLVEKMEAREEECEAAFKIAASRWKEAESRAATLQEELYHRGGREEVDRLRKEVETWRIKYDEREKEYHKAFQLAAGIQNGLKEEVKILKQRIDKGADEETLQLREEVKRLQQKLQKRGDQSGPAFQKALEMVNAAEAKTKTLEEELEAERAKNIEEARNSGRRMREIEEEGRRRFEKFVEEEDKKRKAKEDEYVKALKVAKRMVDEATAKRDEAERTAANLAASRKEAQEMVDAPLKLKYDLKNQEVKDLKERVRSMSKELSNMEQKRQEIQELRESLTRMSEELQRLERENLALRTDHDGVINLD